METLAEFSNKRVMRFESGGYARMADGSAVATLGDTSVLLTAVSKFHPGPPAGFMPLTVDYRQKYAAAGRIPSNYLRRELAPTEKEILTSRIIDRSVRPLFPRGFLNETQLSCHLLAVDGLHDPDVVSINAASAALAVSDIPWEGPIGAVRVGLIDGEVVVLPTRRELSKSSLNLVLTAGENNLVVMLEGGGKDVLQQDLMKAIKQGVKECQFIIKAIKTLANEVGKEKRSFTNQLLVPEEIMNAVRDLCEIRLKTVFTDFTHDKFSRDLAVSKIRMDAIPKLQKFFPEVESYIIHEAFSLATKGVFRNLILDDDIRCDGRSLTDLRPINCAVDLHRPLHGSSIFQRGQTQVQCTVAFDVQENMPKLDTLLEATGGLKDQNFLLHYTFPSFSTNEVARGGPVSRREVGHGALAEKALRPILPVNHPFAILLTATVMESNGSSSMATVCGGSLALMDAGVNITTPAAGVAIGLVTRYNEEGQIELYKTMTDILGIEDYMGDMDFKLAGTKKGVTAIQADVKISGLPLKVVMEAIQQATEAKGNILAIMNATLSHPRKQLKENMPVVDTITVPPHKRSRVMGPGGINIRRIQSETGIHVSWLDDATMSVFAPHQASMEEARETFNVLLNDQEPTLEFGAIYAATIVEVRSQGVMITLYDNMPPVLLHNSQMDTRKIHHPSALGMEVGQEVKVKYFGRDPTSGQMRLSRKALQVSSAALKNLHKALPV